MLWSLARFKAPKVAALVGVFIWFLTFFTGVEIFESIIELLERLEFYEIDEITVGLILVLVGVTIDSLSIKRQRERRVEIFQQRLRVLHATMRTVQDIVGNFLNQLQLFRMQAETCKDFPPESVRELDSMIHETASRLKAIGDLESTPEKEISAGLTIIDIPAASSQKLPDSQQ